MPRYKPPDDELNVSELEKAEYSEGTFESYDGEIPKTGTVLRARVTKMWWTYTKDNDPLMKALAVAEDNDGDLEEFNGLPVWENLTLTTGGKFRWAPFFEVFGFTIRDVKNKLVVSADEDNIGAPIERVGSFEPGSDDAICDIVIKKERYKGEWQAKASDWLVPDGESADDDEDEPEPPPRSRKSQAKPARAKASTARRRAAEPEPDEEDDEEEPASRRGARTRRAATGRSRTRDSRKAGDDEDDEPPF